MSDPLEPYEHAVYTEVVQQTAEQVAAIVEEAVRGLSPRLRMGVAAATLASAAQCMDGQDLYASAPKPQTVVPNGVAWGLQACAAAWERPK